MQPDLEAKLTIRARRSGPVPGVEPLDVALSVNDDCTIDIKMETGTVWRLDLTPAAAAYVAGRLTIAAGVRFA